MNRNRNLKKRFRFRFGTAGSGPVQVRFRFRTVPIRNRNRALNRPGTSSAANPFHPQTLAFSLLPLSLQSFSISMARSSFYLSPHQANPFPSLTRKCTFARLPFRPQTLAFSSKPPTPSQSQSLDETPNQNQTQELNSRQPDKKSFTISTNELFLGIALRLIKSRNNMKAAGAGSETGFLGDGPNGARVSGGGRGAGYNVGERIGVVVEDEIEPDVIWEQRIKGVEMEAEQKRRMVSCSHTVLESHSSTSRK